MPAKQLEANVRQEPGVAVIDLSSPGPEGLRDRGPDPQRIRLEAHPLADQQPHQGRGDTRVQARDLGAGPDRGRAERAQRALPEDETREAQPRLREVLGTGARDRTYEVVLKCMSYVLRYCDGQPRLPITVADQWSS
jgi:hypothetical protein